jgi:predicted TIM-barrel enzyme
MPEDAEWILKQLPELDGFYGASSMERLPTETAIRRQVEEFVQLRR